MSQEHGVKETKEVLDAIVEVGVFAIKRAKDGIDFSDGAALIAEFTGEGDLAKAVKAAGDRIAQVPEEIKDIDVKEGIELGVHVAMKVPRILDALKGN